MPTDDQTGATAAQLYEPTELTIISQVRMDEFLDLNGQRIISKRTSAGGNDDWTIMTGNINSQYIFRVNGLTDTVTKGSGNYLGKLIDVALSVDGDAQDNYVWDLDDDELSTSLGQGGTTVNQSDGNLCIGHRQGENRVWDGDIHYVALFNKKKSSPFIEQFRRNPWQIFAPRIVRIPVGVADVAAAEFLPASYSQTIVRY